jgi:hypothetical protein
MSRTSKFALLLTLFVAFAVTVAAQQSAPPPSPVTYEPLTRLEAFDSQVGTVIIKNYTYIGSVSGLSGIAMVTSYEFVDAQTGRKEFGIGVEIRENSRSEREGRTYIDYDEIDALIRALDYIIKIERSVTLENFEAQYRTRGELLVATFIRPNGALQAAVSIGFFRRAEVVISTGKLADFRKLIADAKTTLDKIK